MTKHRQIVVFIGPSLGVAGFPEGLEADIRPPAAQGDIAEAVLQHGGCVVVLIDGVFQSAPAVRHKEILWALDRGAAVFGAASMGALRAAELSRYGMEGRGFVYRWYRRHALAPDDAVAVLHAPEALGSGALTDAMIDLRTWFRHARRTGRLDRSTEERLVRIATQMHYSQRTLSAVLRAGSAVHLASVLEAVKVSTPSRKQKDARSLLEEIRDRQSVNNWPSPATTRPFVFTDSFAEDLTAGGFSLDSFPNDR